ncbi:ABC transporter permease [Dermatophilaceae bacterium Sec6.4]|nr:ABC transporter permease [Actinomycetota bacterium]
MSLFLLRRFINYVILTLLATTFSYILASIFENPAARFLGRNPRPSNEVIARTLDQYGTNPNTPVLERTWHWFTQLVLHGNLGKEINGQPVVHDMIVRSGVSLQLLLIGAILGAILGVVLGVWGAVRQYRASDQAVTYLSFLVLSIPVYVIGVLLMIIATKFNEAIGINFINFTGQYTPGTSGFWSVLLDRLSHIVLPTIALTATSAASYSRYQRNAMLDVLSADYIRTARSKGRTRGSAMIRHGVRVALIPMSTFFAYSFGLLVTGSVFLETIFSWHGMGELALNSVTQNDINATTGSILYVAILILISSTLSQILYAALDPRVRI